MKRKLTKEYKLLRIAHWKKLMREYPSNEVIQMVGERVIERYSKP